LSDWIIREHPDFFRDLDDLSVKELEILFKKKQKIKADPLRLKHLSGGENCYREAITGSIRLIYYIECDTIWFLTIGRHDASYKEYLKRLHSLRQRMQG